MRNLLEIFRNYLHGRGFNRDLTDKWVEAAKRFFRSQGLNLDDFKCKDIADILMLQSIFSEKILRQYQAGFGVSHEDFSPLYELGNFLVSRSFLSENPAEKVWKIPAECAKVESLSLREFAEGRALKGPTLALTLNRITPAFAFLVVLFFSFNFLNSWRGLPSIPLGARKSAKTKVNLRNNFLRLELAKNVYAESKNQNLDFLINLNNEEKIVSSSAKKVTKK